ncbi:hypothetical protein SAMN05216198_0456 [Halopseudomonas litoralis]|uniref:Uncharacterized protein n=1 Tax=Halopseudomonas litoralis TaxID=797277 RepID=A0A1H1M0E6_9GAMM|nr:hypothetical protein [Halopseudomonas litoralis]SDR80120.1 hypothetical protein SAMN05216198_0456 [Halopseudomonas litoralis]
MSVEPEPFWYCLALGDGLLATVPLSDIEEAFGQLYPRGEAPPDAAVFSRHRLDGLQCEVTVFFSPSLADLARRFKAHPCARPRTRDLELLAGSAGALQL